MTVTDRLRSTPTHQPVCHRHQLKASSEQEARGSPVSESLLPRVLSRASVSHAHTHIYTHAHMHTHTQSSNITGLAVKCSNFIMTTIQCTSFSETVNENLPFGPNKWTPLVYFDDNFGKYGPILTIFSLLQQEIYDAQELSYFSHLTFIMLPLYLVKQTLMLDHASKQIIMYSSG